MRFRRLLISKAIGSYDLEQALAKDTFHLLEGERGEGLLKGVVLNIKYVKIGNERNYIKFPYKEYTVKFSTLLRKENITDKPAKICSEKWRMTYHQLF